MLLLRLAVLRVVDANDRDPVVGEQFTLDRLAEGEPVQHRPELGLVAHRGVLEVELAGGLLDLGHVWSRWPLVPTDPDFDFIRSASAAPLVSRVLNPQDESSSSSLTSMNVWLLTSPQLHTRKVAGSIPAGTTETTTAYIKARDEGKDAAILCDTWEVADDINQRLHYRFTDPDAPSVARDQKVRAGDIIVSRHNDAGLTVAPGAPRREGDRIDQVRNGNRWRVIGVDTRQVRIAAERLTDQARVIFESDYLREHVALGYATTLHSAQGMTIGKSTTPGVCWTVLSDRASRAMAYVGMTRARDENHLAIYPAVTNEAHQHHEADTGIHQMHRGTKYAAAQHFRMIVANDDRVRTMHTVAARTDRKLLPAAVAASLDRNDQRCAARAQAWRQHEAQTHARETAYQRITATSHQRRDRERNRRAHCGYGLEL